METLVGYGFEAAQLSLSGFCFSEDSTAALGASQRRKIRIMCKVPDVDENMCPYRCHLVLS